MKKDEIFEVKIDRLNNEGLGIGKINNITSFVKGALIGEVVDAKVDEIHDNYLTLDLVKVKEKSEYRVKPICPYYDMCGGCDLMHLDYKGQLEFKKSKIESIFKKITKENIKVDNIYFDKNLYYRNKIVLKVKDNKLGYYKRKTNDLIEINECFIANKKMNEIIKKLKDFIKENDTQINEIMIRVIDEKTLICFDNLDEKIKDKFIENFSEVDSIYIKDKLIKGEKTLTKQIDGLLFDVSPKSFFQVNSEISKLMYEKAVSYVNDSDKTLDLYCGTGTITLLLSKKSKEVIGIEKVKDAVKDAVNNMNKNNIKNVTFICNKVENEITKLKNIDNIVMDSARSGSDKKTLKTILDLNPKKIIYISCNPVTLARDYNILKEKYIIKDINAYDMFPNTYHVETVMVLERK